MFEKKIEKDVADMTQRIQQVENAIATGTITDDAKNRFAGIRKQVDALRAEKQSGMNPDDSQINRTAVFQNFNNVPLDQAEKWIMTECAKFDVGKVIKTYAKDKFTDKVWVVFESMASRDSILERIRKLSTWSCEGSVIRAKPDQVVEDRVQQNVLFGIKHLLSLWGYPRNCIWVDIQLKQVSCGHEVVAKVEIKDQILEVTFGTGWDTWDVFTNDAALKDLIVLEKSKLSKAVEFKGKGKGKKGKGETSEKGVGK